MAFDTFQTAPTARSTASIVNHLPAFQGKAFLQKSSFLIEKADLVLLSLYWNMALAQQQNRTHLPIFRQLSQTQQCRSNSANNYTHTNAQTLEDLCWIRSSLVYIALKPHHSGFWCPAPPLLTYFSLSISSTTFSQAQYLELCTSLSLFPQPHLLAKKHTLR